MVISEKLLNELQYLNKETESILLSNSLTDIQAETFFRNLEKRKKERFLGYLAALQSED